MTHAELVRGALADRIASGLPIPLPTRAEDDEPVVASLRPYTGWLTPQGGAPERIEIQAVRSKDEALERALAAGRSKWPGRGFAAMVRPEK